MCYLVAVHDGVRPLVSVELIDRCFATAQRTGSAIPVVNPSDSIRQVTEDGNSCQLLRSSLRAVQTPQTFKAELLRGAYDVDESPLFTDDASVVQALRLTRVRHFGPVKHKSPVFHILI